MMKKLFLLGITIVILFAGTFIRFSQAAEYKSFKPTDRQAVKWVLPAGKGLIVPACTVSSPYPTDWSRYNSIQNAYPIRVCNSTTSNSGGCAFRINSGARWVRLWTARAIQYTVINSSGSNYFIPNKDATEWDNFNANLPGSVTSQESWIAGSCTTDTHKKGYGCHLTTYTNGNYTVTCEYHNEDRGEWTGTITQFSNTYPMSGSMASCGWVCTASRDSGTCGSYTSTGTSFKGAAVEMNSDGSRTLISWGKHNNHSCKRWSERRCKAGGLRR